MSTLVKCTLATITMFATKVVWEYPIVSLGMEGKTMTRAGGSSYKNTRERRWLASQETARYSRFADRPEDCPKCLRGHSHTHREHEEALRRNDEASQGDA